MPYEPSLDEMMFFDGKPRALALYLAFAEQLFARCPEAGKRVQKTQITFTAPKVFSCVSMMNVRPAKQRPKEYIVITFGLNQWVVSPRMDAAAEPCPGRWTHHVLVVTPEEIDDELLGWVQAAYRFSLMK